LQTWLTKMIQLLLWRSSLRLRAVFLMSGLLSFETQPQSSESKPAQREIYSCGSSISPPVRCVLANISGTTRLLIFETCTAAEFHMNPITLCFLEQVTTLPKEYDNPMGLLTTSNTAFTKLATLLAYLILEADHLVEQVMFFRYQLFITPFN
jgi:hypothetical protein